MRSAERRVAWELDRSQLDQRVDQRVDRRFAELGKRRVRRAPAGDQLESKNPPRRQAETVVRRLAVDQIPAAAGRRFVRAAGPVAAALFADDEHQSHARFTGAHQRVRRRHLRRQNPFGVATATPEHPIAFYTAGKERRDTVEVG